jgi:U3 small nucleolar RNA-associated protein 3
MLLFNLVSCLLKNVGATKLGQQYLLTKSLIQSSAALNLVMYLLLKAEQSDVASKNKKVIDPALIQSHPVMLHLQKLNSLSSKLEDGVESQVNGLLDQLETLVKAANLLNSTSRSNDDEDSDDVDNHDDNEVDNSDSDGDDMVNTKNDVDGQGTHKKSLHDTMVSSDSEDDDDDSLIDEDAVRRITLNDARFGLRPNEIQNLQHTKGKQRKQNKIFISDAGDDDIDNVDDVQRKKIGQSLATTLNTIEQRTKTQRKKSKHSSQQLVEYIDEPNDDDNDGELRRGLEMMEEALGKQSDNEDEPDVYDPELDEYDNGNDDDFYSRVSKKSKAMKDSRKQQYSVAPKFPRIEPDIPGERTASKQIIKNRGLVAHKAKINRNPRVKKREQFRKAKIRMAGTVPQIRSPNEGQNYGGEATGISMNVTRSRKLV